MLSCCDNQSLEEEERDLQLQQQQQYFSEQLHQHCGRGQEMEGGEEGEEDDGRRQTENLQFSETRIQEESGDKNYFSMNNDIGKELFMDKEHTMSNNGYLQVLSLMKENMSCKRAECLERESVINE